MKKDKLLLAAALTVPVLVFFGAYFWNHVPGLHPTGFIQYDNVSYIAYARQYLDQDGLHLQYANPFNDGPQYPPIYFQVQTLLFALLLKIGFPVFLILPLFTILCAFLCFYLLIGIYDHLVPEKKYRATVLVLFSWGGGLLVVAGMLYHFLFHPEGSLAGDLFTIDPEGGWWGLNLGRSLLFSCEAYYHALFLASVYFILKRRWLIALVFQFLLTISHPFTGIELSLIICAWILLEILFRNRLPWWFAAGAILITVFHLWYYLYYLEQFPEHRSVREQYSLTWGLRYYRMIPAYIIVGLLAIFSAWHARLKNFLMVTSNRLFLCWFLVAFLLANHDLFIEPRQPIHFTRGYIWTSLFLLGIPALHAWLRYLNLKRSNILLIIFMGVFLMDNIIWIGVKAVNKAAHPGTAYVTTEQRQLLRAVNQHSTPQTLLVSNESDLAYLSAVYSASYPLYTHPYTTPFALKKQEQQQRLLYGSTVDAGWKKRELLLLISKKDTTATSTAQQLRADNSFESANYVLYTIRP